MADMKSLVDCVVERVMNTEPLGVLCDKCGSDQITEISYGLPGYIIVDEPIDPRIEYLVRENLIVHGGCVIDNNSPRYYCRACGNEFGIVDRKNDERRIQNT